jgi:hypothetical protein
VQKEVLLGAERAEAEGDRELPVQVLPVVREGDRREMSNSTHGPQRGCGEPFVMHLERVVRFIEMGARFEAVEFHPNSDQGQARGAVIRRVGLRIREGGAVNLIALDGTEIYGYGLSLANYKRTWRIWQNGVPTEAQRRALRWG